MKNPRRPGLLFGLRLILTIVFICRPVPSRAGVDVWTSNGPFGGNLLSLVIAPSNSSIIYAGTDGGGVFKSGDAGSHWKLTPLTNRAVAAIAVDSFNPEIAYAGFGGLSKTTDGGLSWTDLNTGVTNLAVRALAIDPSNSRTVYAGTDSGVIKSIDAGANWAPVNNGLVPTRTAALAIDPSTPSTIYAGLGNGAIVTGIYKSSAAGGHWTPKASVGAVTFAIDRFHPDTVYAGMSGGVIKTIDGGETWRQPLIGGDVRALAVDPSDTNTIYAGEALTDGVMKTTDGGNNWAGINTGLAVKDVRALAIDPSSTGTLYAGISTCGGAFKTTDGGNNWAEANQGLAASDVRTLAVDVSDSSTLYAGTFGRGVFKTADRAGAWTSAAGANSFVYKLVLDPSDPRNLYAGTQASAWRTTDGGDNWVVIWDGLFDPNWLQSLFVPAMGLDPSNPSTLYAGNIEGFFRSTDSGRSWINNGALTQQLRCLAVDPSNPDIIYGGGDSRVYKSTDRGTTWTYRTNPLGSIRDLAVDPQNPALIYAASLNGESRSTDGGLTWNFLPLTVDGFGFVAYAVAINPFNPNVAYMGTAGGGVFRTTDRGSNWAQINSGLTNVDVRAIAIDPINTNIVHAGTSAGGVFSIQLRPVISAASLNGKNVTIAGENFSRGAVILMNGAPQKTMPDPGNAGNLIGKKLARKIAPGQTVLLQVQNPDGTLSDEFSLMRTP